MNTHFDDFEKYASYEEQFDPLQSDRQARRKRKPKANHAPKKSAAAIRDEVADVSSWENDYSMTYQPARHEEGWLLSSLNSFYEQEMITDVVAVVKGGKEASVYRCAAHPATGLKWVAAKVYRPRMFRNLRNDHIYRQGRSVVTIDGRPVKDNDHRVLRALNKKTAFGEQVAHTSWLMHEYLALQKLYTAGAAVPRPIAAADNAILMSYIGDENVAAPTLNGIRLHSDEVQPFFRKVLHSIEIMLQQGFIHGDLSAYNILYWDGDLTLIDFPQITDSYNNSQARFILLRDIQRICDYFGQQGLDGLEAAAIMQKLWDMYVSITPEDQAVQLSARLEMDEWREQ